MTSSNSRGSLTKNQERQATYSKVSIYTGIGVLAVGGALLVVFILTGASGNVIFRSLITLGLLAAFAYAVIAETYHAHAREGWVTLARIVILLLTLGAGIWHVWSPVDLNGSGENYYVEPREFIFRAFLFLATVGALQLAALGFSILDKRIKAHRVSGAFLSVLSSGIGAFALAMGMVALGFTFPHEFFPLEAYWRIFTALVVVAVILIIIPAMARALNPEEKKAPAVNSGFNTAIAQQPAGWYPSEHPAMERFWNGTSWTDYTRPAGVDDEAPPTTEGKI